MCEIKDIRIRKILDSRGHFTVESTVSCSEGSGRAAAPSGASTGKSEVVAIPKGGIDQAIINFRRNIIPKMIGHDAGRQKDIDELLHKLDGTDDFSKIGGNLTTAFSLAVAKAAASSQHMPLYVYLGGHMRRRCPHPYGNVLNGGRHAQGGTDIQEFLVIARGKSVQEEVFANALVHQKLNAVIAKNFPGMAIGRGDEGGWVVQTDNRKALTMVQQAAKEAEKESGVPIRLALDLAASEFYSKGKYIYNNKPETLDTKGQIQLVKRLIDEFDLFSVEDPLQEDDFEGYAELTDLVGDRCLVIGDDIFTTNSKRLEKGIKMKSANAILIKVNQIGTLTDAYEAIRLAQNNGYKTVISHRSGETEDETIADVGTAFDCFAIKTGAVGGERIAKLNQLIRIEESMEE